MVIFHSYVSSAGGSNVIPMENLEGRMNGEAHRIMVRSAADGGADFSFQHRMYMGLSENSVPLHPMVNDHYPY